MATRGAHWQRNRPEAAILSLKGGLPSSSLPKVSIIILHFLRDRTQGGSAWPRTHGGRPIQSRRAQIRGLCPPLPRSCRPPGHQPRAQRARWPCHPSVPVRFWPGSSKGLARAPPAGEARRGEPREARAVPQVLAHLPPRWRWRLRAAGGGDDGWPVCRLRSEQRGTREWQSERAPHRPVLSAESTMPAPRHPARDV